MEENGRSATTRLMKLRWITGALALALLGALAVVYKFPPAENTFYPRCMFFVTTHLLCPGCGSTRALYALLHLDLRSALHYNALFTVVAPGVFLWLAFCFYRVMRYNQLPLVKVPRELTACAIVLVLLFTIARNTMIIF
jgi:Protein of unknown function (DUF2752)